MAEFTQMSFSPETGLNDRDVYPTTPLSESEARNSIQGISNQIRDYINNTLVVELHNAQHGMSGAEKIGSAEISGVSGHNIREQLESIAFTVSGVEGISAPGDNTVSTTKIQDDAVTESKIMAGSVTTTKIPDGAVTTNKIAYGAVTGDKIAAGVLDGSNLTDYTVTGDKIASDAIDENKILAGAIVSTKIATNAITAVKIASEAVTTDKLGIIHSIKISADDSIIYDNSNDILILRVAGCSDVQLAPIILGTNPPSTSASYPKGTLYIQYQP